MLLTPEAMQPTNCDAKWIGDRRTEQGCNLLWSLMQNGPEFFHPLNCHRRENIGKACTTLYLVILGVLSLCLPVGYFISNGTIRKDDDSWEWQSPPTYLWVGLLRNRNSLEIKMRRFLCHRFKFCFFALSDLQHFHLLHRFSFPSHPAFVHELWTKTCQKVWLRSCRSYDQQPRQHQTRRCKRQSPALANRTACTSSAVSPGHHWQRTQFWSELSPSQEQEGRTPLRLRGTWSKLLSQSGCDWWVENWKIYKSSLSIQNWPEDRFHELNSLVRMEKRKAQSWIRTSPSFGYPHFSNNLPTSLSFSILWAKGNFYFL